MQSKAKTVPEYLDSLPLDRRAELEAVRRVVLDSLDTGFEECMQYGMIGYCVPHRLFPDGYHCDPKQPLPMAGLAAQKHAFSLYVMPLYGDMKLLQWFTGEWKKAGKKLDMGKSCIRFKKADDLALDVIASLFQRIGLRYYVDAYVAMRDGGAAARAKAKASAAAKATGKKPAAKAGKAPAKKRAAR